MAYPERHPANTGQWVAIATLALAIFGGALDFYGQFSKLEQRVMDLETIQQQHEDKLRRLEPPSQPAQRAPRGSPR
jgi:hypothetical protein